MLNVGLCSCVLSARVLVSIASSDQPNDRLGHLILRVSHALPSSVHLRSFSLFKFESVFTKLSLAPSVSSQSLFALVSLLFFHSVEYISYFLQSRLFFLIFLSFKVFFSFCFGTNSLFWAWLPFRNHLRLLNNISARCYCGTILNYMI